MNIIDINIDNIDKEHICCVISDKRGLVVLTSNKEDYIYQIQST